MEKNTDALIVIASLQKEADPIIRAIKRIEITDSKSYNLMSEKVHALKQYAKIAEAREKALIDPLKKVQSDIKAHFEPFKTLVTTLETQAKLEMVEYVKQVEAKKQKVKQDLESGKIAKLSTAVRKTTELEINSPTSSVRKIWVVEEIDANVTPREYLVPDLAKIREAFKAGKKVLGWQYVQRETIAI